MGMYTEFNFAADLRLDTPPDVIQALQFIFGKADKPESLPDHEFFKIGYHEILLRPGFIRPLSATLSIDEDGEFNPGIAITCSTKRPLAIYTFLDWIHPYLDDGYHEFLGYLQYEEDMNPTLIILRDGRIFTYEVPIPGKLTELYGATNHV